MPSRSDNPMTTLTDALAAVAAEMREMENKGYAYAAIGGAIIKWADRIEQALATQHGEAVAWAVVRDSDGYWLDILTSPKAAYEYRQAGEYERQACTIIPLYLHPSPPTRSLPHDHP